MKSATFLCIFQIIGLVYSMPAQAVQDGEQTDPAAKFAVAPSATKWRYNSRGFLVEYTTEIRKTQTKVSVAPGKTVDKTGGERKRFFSIGDKPKSATPPVTDVKPEVVASSPASKKSSFLKGDGMDPLMTPSLAPSGNKLRYNSRGFLVECPAEIAKTPTNALVAPTKKYEKKSLEERQKFFTSSKSKEVLPAEQLQSKPAHPWTVVPTYNWSFFNKGRDSWQEENVDLYYYVADKQLLLGTSIDMMHRPPNGDDIVYSLNAAWYARNNVELHGEVSLTHEANFLPSERYSLGLQYSFNEQMEFLFDAEQLSFGPYAPTWDDGISQIKPGVSYWFTEKVFCTLRYTHGWVHGESDYDNYSASVNIGDLPRDGQLILGISYGTDPDLDFGTSNTALSDAYTFNILYKEPINPDLTFFVGLEYIYRLRADNNGELYQMLTPTIGLSWKF